MKIKSNRILMLFIFTFSLCHSYSQEVKNKLDIIDTLKFKGQVLHIIGKSNIAEHYISSYTVDIFIPDCDSIDIFNKKELKSYLEANNHIYYVWPSKFFFMIRAVNPEKVEKFKYFDETTLQGSIGNATKIKCGRLDITAYYISSSDFIVAKTDVNFLKNYFGKKMIKQESGFVKLVVPNIYTKSSIPDKN